MRRLAEELGLSSMGSYYYVGSKQELLDLVADEVLGLVPAPPPGDAWDDQLLFLFERARAVLLDHPGVSDHLLVRATPRPNQLRLHRLAARILRSAGLTRAEVDATERVFTYLLLGAVSQELATASAEDRDDTMAFVDDAEVYRFGLDVLIDGLRSRVGHVAGDTTGRADRGGTG
jgi:AcrR family transcriptional regulator